MSLMKSCVPFLGVSSDYFVLCSCTQKPDPKLCSYDLWLIRIYFQEVRKLRTLKIYLTV